MSPAIADLVDQQQHQHEHEHEHEQERRQALASAASSQHASAPPSSHQSSLDHKRLSQILQSLPVPLLATTSMMMILILCLILTDFRLLQSSPGYVVDASELERAQPASAEYPAGEELAGAALSLRSTGSADHLSLAEAQRLAAEAPERQHRLQHRHYHHRQQHRNQQQQQPQQQQHHHNQLPAQLERAHRLRPDEAGANPMEPDQVGAEQRLALKQELLGELASRAAQLGSEPDQADWEPRPDQQQQQPSSSERRHSRRQHLQSSAAEHERRARSEPAASGAPALAALLINLGLAADDSAAEPAGFESRQADATAMLTGRLLLDGLGEGGQPGQAGSAAPELARADKQPGQADELVREPRQRQQRHKPVTPSSQHSQLHSQQQQDQVRLQQEYPIYQQQQQSQQLEQKSHPSGPPGTELEQSVDHARKYDVPQIRK